MIWRCDSAAVSVWMDKIMCCWWRPEFAVQHLNDASLSANDYDEVLQDLILLAGEFGNTSFSIELSAETEGLEGFFAAVKESVSSTGLATESMTVTSHFRATAPKSCSKGRKTEST